MARRLRRYSVVAGDAITIPDFFAKRFHDKKGVVSTIAAVITLVFFSVYVGSCFVTVGKLFATLFGFDYHVMMIIGAVVVFVYTVVGGYLSVVMTDFIQGMLMFFALAVVFIGTVASAGGVDEAPSGIPACHPRLPVRHAGGRAQAGPGHRPAARRGGQGRVRRALRLRHHHHHLHAGVGPGLLRYAAGAGALPVHPQRGRSAQVPNHRHLLVRDFAGLRSVHRLGGACDDAHRTADLHRCGNLTFFIVLAQTLLPSFMCGVVVSGIFAASMSSSSSYLIIGASAMGQNIFRGLLHRKATDKQVMIVARVTLVVMFLFGILVAYDQNSSIFQVVSYAWAGLGASFGPLMLCSLYWRRANKAGAVRPAVLSGTAAVLIWHNLVKPLGGVFAIYELLPAFIISLLFIVVVSLLTAKPNKRMLYEFDHYMDDPLPGTLPSGTVLVDEPMEAMESEVRSGK